MLPDIEERADWGLQINISKHFPKYRNFRLRKLVLMKVPLLKRLARAPAEGDSVQQISDRG